MRLSTPVSAGPRYGQRPRTLAAALLLACSQLAWADDARVEILVFGPDNAALTDVAISVDQGAQVKANRDGVIRLQLAPGQHALRLSRDGQFITEIPHRTVADQLDEIIVSLDADNIASVMLESSASQASDSTAQSTVSAVVPGTLSGVIRSAEDQAPVSGARIFVSGTPVEIKTDETGRFTVELPPGNYSISVLADSYSTQTMDGIAITALSSTTREIEITPAGLDLPEFVVLEPFIEGSLAAFVEEKRTSSAVTDILGAEQISRAGDSDAAGALKRVTGLTLVDGKFIYVRGLGERYSSTLLNGAQVPSPDPTRRVVPLDLFPTEILNGIVVQKTYAADMPGEFGGGTVQLRTRGVPESFLLRASATFGYVDGTTGETGLGYRGGSRDWLGYDDGTRAAPDGLLNVPPLPTGTSLEALGQALAAKGYATAPEKIGPNTGYSLSIGDDFKFSDGAWSLGYIAALRYAENWDLRNEERAFFALAGDRLVKQQESQRDITERAVDTGLFTSVGLTIGERHRINATALQVRQTTDEVQTDTGVLGSGEFERLRSLEWIENELRVGQINGEHSLPRLHDLLLSWQYTKAEASRVAPNSREQRFSFNENTETFRVDVFGFEQRFETLQDDSEEYKFDLRMPFEFNQSAGITASAGLTDLQKARNSRVRRFRFSTSGPQFNSDNPETFFNEATIGTGFRDYRLLDRTLPTDSYTATVDLQAHYLALDAYWNDFRLYIGAREEQILQEVVTVTPFDPNATPQIGQVDEKDRLPAATLTWAYSDQAQLRLAFGESVSRPDIREQSPANFIDPLLDLRVVGNPDLKQAAIESLDLRWEYYFSATESLSLAFFQKDFTDPIELIESAASGTLLNIINAKSAINRGFEIDYYRSLEGVDRFRYSPKWLGRVPWNDLFLGFNYAWIDSEIDLGDSAGISTNSQRPLQGQSPYVGNLSLAYLPTDGKVEATLLYNVFGERISQVGASSRPDTYEQPFKQLDFTMSAALPWDGWKLKLRLKNLLDPEATFTVGDEVARRFSKGREAAVSVEWRY
jgi:hypothetical protein